MWSRTVRRRSLSLSSRVFILQLVVVAAMLIAVTFASILQSRASFHRVDGQRMLTNAESLASTPLVQAQVGTPQAALALAPAVDKAQSLSNATIVAITDPLGSVVASSVPEVAGGRSPLVMPAALGGRSWTGDVAGPDGQYVAANVPLLTTAGKVSGVVVLAQKYPPLGSMLAAAVPDLLLILGIGAGLGVLGSWALSRLVRRDTRGLEPHEIAHLADHREALLYSIREGVIGVDADGRVTLLNRSAMELLDLTGDCVGALVSDLPLEAYLQTVLLGATDETETVSVSGSRIIVLNRRAATSHGEHLGTVTTLRDRTELVQLQSQLTMNQSVTETMRAQTHEFSNTLHTISGLVQLSEFDEVRQFIGVLSKRNAAISREVSRHIESASVAALLVAKTTLAAEAGRQLKLTEESALPAVDESMAADIITVLGNLVDNAVDATAGLDEKAPILVDLRHDASAVTVTVADSGPGVPEDLERRIFTRGFTTKDADAPGRGVGLALVRLICSRRGGRVQVRSDHGATFQATLPFSTTERA